MHGQIIESGSHHDLLSSKGKYHDLWSKQIFVTPSPARGRSSSPRKGETHIINDVTSSTQKIELAKAMRHVEQKRNTGQNEVKGAETGTQASIDSSQKVRVSGISNWSTLPTLYRRDNDNIMPWFFPHRFSYIQTSSFNGKIVALLLDLNEVNWLLDSSNRIPLSLFHQVMMKTMKFHLRAAAEMLLSCKKDKEKRIAKRPRSVKDLSEKWPS